MLEDVPLVVLYNPGDPNGVNKKLEGFAAWSQSRERLWGVKPVVSEPMKILLRIAALLAALALSLGLAHAANPLDSGPTTLTMAYHTRPGDRLALKDYMRVTGLKQFAGWRDQGIIKDYRVYWSRYADSLNWDMLVVVQFADTKKVVGVEEDRGALSRRASRSAWRSSAPRSTPIPRTCTSAAASRRPTRCSSSSRTTTSSPRREYLKYVQSYITPQYDGWIGEKVLAGYQIYLGRFPVSRYWSALMILEYRTRRRSACASRPSNKVRAKLRENPEWKAIHESKQNVRVTRQYVMADLLK